MAMGLTMAVTASIFATMHPAQGAFMTQAAVGSPATCAARIEDFLRDCDIDGLMFVYDDYVEGLRVTAREILPQLRRAFA